MKAFSIVSVAAVLLAGSASASAQTTTEARCIVLSNVFAKEGKDDAAKKLAEAAFYFYLGRVSPQATSAQLKAQLDAQMRTITDANAGTLMSECIKNVQSRVQLLQSIAGPPKPPGPPQGR